MENLKSFIDISLEEFTKYTEKIDTEALRKAADLIIAAKKNGNRVHITGIGKTAHVAKYAAASFSSVGTPTYYLHGTESVHGSCGQLIAGDIVIAISNSGGTVELKTAVTAIKNNGAKVIAVTGNPNSWLAENAEVTLIAGVEREGGVLNRAPRTSILVEAHILQCLSVLLQEECELTPQQYVKWHPGGALGNLREGE
jgi:arabinose-5-phosphate isomerase